MMFSIGSSQWPGISKLVEEAGELLQVAGKLMGARGQIQHWDGTNLRERLQDELGDLLAAVGFVIRFCDLDDTVIEKRRVKKRALFEHWHTTNAPALPARSEDCDRSDLARAAATKLPCPACNGRGRWSTSTCPDCHGTGEHV